MRKNVWISVVNQSVNCRIVRSRLPKTAKSERSVIVLGRGKLFVNISIEKRNINDIDWPTTAALSVTIRTKRAFSTIVMKVLAV